MATTSYTVYPTVRPHALILVAGVALLLFCAAATAIILGWLPASLADDADRDIWMPVDAVSAQAAPAQAAAVAASPAPDAPHEVDGLTLREARTAANVPARPGRAARTTSAPAVKPATPALFE